MFLVKSLAPAVLAGAILTSCGGDPSRPINQPGGNNQLENDRVAPFCESNDNFELSDVLIAGKPISNEAIDRNSVNPIVLQFNAPVGLVNPDEISISAGSQPLSVQLRQSMEVVEIGINSDLEFNTTYSIKVTKTISADCRNSKSLASDRVFEFTTDEDPEANPDAPIVTFVGLESGKTQGTDEDRIRVTFNEAVKLNEKALIAFFPTKDGEVEVDISDDNTETTEESKFSSVYNRPIARELDDADGILRLIINPDLIEDQEMNTAVLQTQPTAVKQTTEIILNKPSIITSVFGEQDLAAAESALLDQPDNLTIDIQLDRPLARKVAQEDGSCEFNSSAFSVDGLAADKIITSYPSLPKTDTTEAEEVTLCDTSVVLVSFADIALNQADEQYTLSIDGSKLLDEFGATTDMGVFDSGRLADPMEMSDQGDDPASNTADIKFSITDSAAPIALSKIKVDLNGDLSDKTEIDLISSSIFVDGVDPRTDLRLGFNRQIKVTAGTADQENNILALLDSQPIDGIDCIADSEGAVALILEPKVDAEAGVVLTILSSMTLDSKTVYKICSLTGLIEPKDALEGDQVELSTLMPTFPILFETGQVAPIVSISIDNPEVAQSTDEPLVITISDYDGEDGSLCSEITVVDTDNSTNIEGSFSSKMGDDDQLICTFEPTSKLVISDLNNLGGSDVSFDFNTDPGNNLQPLTQRRFPRSTEILVTVPEGKFENTNGLSNDEVTSQFRTKNEIFLSLDENSITLAIADGVDSISMTPEVRLVGPDGVEQELSFNDLVEAFNTCFPDGFTESSLTSNCIAEGLSSRNPL